MTKATDRTSPELGTIDSDLHVEEFHIKDIDEKRNEDLQRSSLLYEFKSQWLQYAGENVKVAVLDTGIDMDHLAFEGVVTRGATVADGVVTVCIGEGVDPEARYRLADTNGHGTHCAGIIAARPLGDAAAYRPLRFDERQATAASAPAPNSGLSDAPAAIFGQAAGGSPPQQTPEGGLDPVTSGWKGTTWRLVSQPDPDHDAVFDDLKVKFSGLAPLAELLIYKVSKDDSGVVRLNDLALAIDTAVDDGADIISISIGGNEGTDQLFGAVHRALRLRRTVVASAGNRGRLREVNIGYPGRYGGLITVAAHDGFGQPSAFTSAGGEIDMSGPGEKVWSSWPGQRYRSQSGTSMAAPWIAGVAALVLSKHRRFARQGHHNETPLRNIEDLRQHLLLMAAHRGSYDPSSGYGPLWPGDYFGRQSVDI